MRSVFIYNIETIILTSYFILSDALITRSRTAPLCHKVIIHIYIYIYVCVCVCITYIYVYSIT